MPKPDDCFQVGFWTKSLSLYYVIYINPTKSDILEHLPSILRH